MDKKPEKLVPEVRFKGFTDDWEQRKLEQLKQLKKAMLQQLFVDKNNKQPNLRFKNFKGNWEQHRLEEVAQVTMGQSPSCKYYTRIIKTLVHV